MLKCSCVWLAVFYALRFLLPADWLACSWVAVQAHSMRLLHLDFICGPDEAQLDDELVHDKCQPMDACLPMLAFICMLPECDLDIKL